MKSAFCPFSEAILILVVGVALFFSGCVPKGVTETPRVVERPQIVEAPPVEESLQLELFARAEKALLEGNYDLAIESFEQYLQQNPRGEKSREALYRIAGIHFESHRYENSLALLDKITTDYPDHPEQARVEKNIVTTTYRLGDFDQAIIKASRWIERYPFHPMKGEVFFLLGENFRALGNRLKAFQWWLKAYLAHQESSSEREEIEDEIFTLIGNAKSSELTQMVESATGSNFVPHIFHRLASVYIEENRLEDARAAAMSLVRSTSEQYWVSIGRRIFERIELELSVKAGVVGCLLPLSGPFAIYGQEVLNGIQLGMGLFGPSEEDNALELIIKDTGGTSKTAVTMVEELAVEDKVVAIIGPLASKPSSAAAKRAQELGIPIITLTQKGGITSEGDMVFRNYLTPDKEVKRVLQKAMNDMAFKRFGILYPDNSYGHFFMNLFWDNVEEMGGNVTAAESYAPDDTDFSEEIKKMVGLHYPRPESLTLMLEEMKWLAAEEEIVGAPFSDGEPVPIVDFDAVFIPDNYQQVALIAPQFPFNNVFDIRFVGTSLWQSVELIEMAGEYIQGAFFPSGFFPDRDYDPMKEFVKRYRENFEAEPGILAATGYDTMMFLKELLGHSSIKTRRDFQKELSAFVDFYGITGWITFDPQGEVVKDPVLLTISGRQLTLMP